jgi:hypothetical protein
VVCHVDQIEGDPKVYPPWARSEESLISQKEYWVSELEVALVGQMQESEQERRV